MEMNSNVLNSKCQSCGSELIYNPKLGCLTCKYCSTNVFLPKKKENSIIVREYSADFHPNQLNQSLKSYKCNGCGNIYYMSSEESSKQCPNCGMTSSVVDEDPGYCADGVVPFKVTKEQAKSIFAKHMKSKGISLTAKESELEGVFIPVWNFMYNVDSAYSASATELRRYSDGTYYSISKPVYGEKHKRVKSQGVSATNLEADEFLSLFDENDYAGILPYSPEYTYGYKVETINKNIHDYYYGITSKAEDETKSEISKKILNSYKEVSNMSIDSRVNDVYFNFTYVPVYVNKYTRKNKTFKTYISGTTGKTIGHSPTSAKSILSTITKLLLLIGAIVLLILILKSE